MQVLVLEYEVVLVREVREERREGGRDERKVVVVFCRRV